MFSSGMKKNIKPEHWGPEVMKDKDTTNNDNYSMYRHVFSLSVPSSMNGEAPLFGEKGFHMLSPIYIVSIPLGCPTSAGETTQA